MNGHSFEEIAARAANRAVTAFVFVSDKREDIAPEVLEADGFLLTASADQSDPSHIVFPLQFDDAVKQAPDIITADRVQDVMHRMTTRLDKLAALRSVGSEITGDLEENFIFSEDLMRQLSGIPQKFSVAFNLGEGPVAAQIDAKIPFVRLDRDLHEIGTAADSVGGHLQGVKVVHTSMADMADDMRSRFGIGFRLSPLQQLERKVHRTVQDWTGYKMPTLLN